jgi:arylsulfatase A-like enzyme
MARAGLTAFEAERENFGWRNRTGSAVDLDDMLGVLLDGLAAMGLEDSTYVIVTSDNGYHLGSHKLPMGKEHPYETDVRIPLLIRGPGVPRNSSLEHPVTQVDLTATLLELAGAAAVGPALDGLSFVPALGGQPLPASSWRNFSYSEHFGGQNTWAHVRQPLAAAEQAAAARSSFTRWCTNQSEVYDLAADPLQLQNLAGTPGRGAAVANETLQLALALLACSGQNCSVPSMEQEAAPLPCYKTTRVAEARV